MGLSEISFGSFYGSVSHLRILTNFGLRVRLNHYKNDLLYLSETQKSAELKQKLTFIQYAVGAVPSPFDCFLVNRGLKTLHVRMKRHGENGMAVAKWLESNERVASVSYPGLPSHPQHEVFKKNARGMSGMVTFVTKGKLENAKAVLENFKVFTLAESLGGFESLAEHPAIMTHASVPAEQRAVLGISDTLIRLSVGLENVEDLINDLDQALNAALPEGTY